MNTTQTQNMKNKHFWNWKNDSNSSEETARELFLYGTIAESSWYDDDLTPEMFRTELYAGSGPVTIWLNSYGGDCVAASQIYSMLMEYPGEITVKIDGIAASAASVIAMSGTTVLMAPTSCLMIHDPMTVAMGNMADMEKAIDMLTAVKDSIITAYEIKTGMDRDTLSHLMSQETWMDCRKAIELGFADGMMERPPVTDLMEPMMYAAPMLYARKPTDMALLNKLYSCTEGIAVRPLYERLERLRE